jgi:hypothetical protein
MSSEEVLYFFKEHCFKISNVIYHVDAPQRNNKLSNDPSFPVEDDLTSSSTFGWRKYFSFDKWEN